MGIDYAQKVFRYYWSNRELLKEYVAVHVMNIKPSGYRQREIQISSEEPIPGADFGKDGWKVQLPDCCVVCGRRTDRDWQTDSSVQENLAAPLWAPVLGTAAGLLLAVLVWSRWMLPVGIVAGFALGYRYRSQTRVEVRFRRCEQDSDNHKFPRVRLFSDLLIIRVGQSSVRQKFLGLQMVVAASDEASSEETAAAEAGPPAAEPSRIAIAEETHGTVVFDDRPRLAPDTEPSGDAWFPEQGAETRSAESTPAATPLAPYSQGTVFPAPAAEAPPANAEAPPANADPPLPPEPNPGAAGH